MIERNCLYILQRRNNKLKKMNLNNCNVYIVIFSKTDKIFKQKN